MITLKNWFNSDAPFMQILVKIADLVVLNFLTVLLSVPIVTIGAAVTALYDSVWRIQNDGGSIYKSFFVAFKNNFKQATIIWMLVLLAGVLILVSILFYSANDLTVFMVISVILVLLWAIAVSWVFPLLSRFDNPIKVTIKNAILCGLGHLPQSLVMVVLNLLPWGILLFLNSVFVVLGSIWITLWFSLTAYLNMKMIRKSLSL